MAGMTHERFQALADAFGGDVSRWPAEVREAAAVLMATEPELAGRTLVAAQALDAALDACRQSPASSALVARVLAAAPRPARRRRFWLSPAALGAGLAAAAAAGVIVGAQMSQRSSDSSEVAVADTLSLEPAYDILEGA